MVYYCEEFLDKNNDTLNADFETALLASTKPLVVEVCTPEEDPNPSWRTAVNCTSVRPTCGPSARPMMSLPKAQRTGVSRRPAWARLLVRGSSSVCHTAVSGVAPVAVVGRRFVKA